MEFIKPKKKTKVNITLEVNNETKCLLDNYSKYTGYSSGEVLDKFLVNLKEDKDFIDWAANQRYKKKIESVLSSEINKDEESSNESPD